jgi:hypothetical protein
MKEHMKYIINTATFIIVSGFIYAAYLTLYTPKFFETEQPFRLEKTSYRIGDTLTYTSVYCKFHEYIPLNIRRSLVNGYVYPLPDVSPDVKSLGTFPVGCRTVNVDVPLTLPTKIPTNQKYHVEIIIDYYINPLQTQTRTFKTEDFTLMPAVAN